MVSSRPPHPPRNADHSVYDLAEVAPKPPALPGAVAVARTADEVIDVLAADLVIHAENCIREFGDFHLALSGGPIFEGFYQRLMYDPNYRRLPWRRTHLWIVSEACVPLDHPHSTFRQINETIGDHADIPTEQLHPILAQSPNAAAEYEATLKEALAWREKGHDRLDYVLLTVGADGQTAGLFPGAGMLRVEASLMQRTHRGDEPESGHITMTPSIINAARFVSLLVTGAGRAPVIERVARGAETADELPVMRLSPIDGMMKWYLDAPACGAEEHGEED